MSFSIRPGCLSTRIVTGWFDISVLGLCILRIRIHGENEYYEAIVNRERSLAVKIRFNMATVITFVD